MNKLTPEEQARRQKAAKKNHEAKRQSKEKAQRLAAKRTPTARALVPQVTLAEILDARLTVTTKKFPTLTWMDTDGLLHREHELSAEQLIERWQAAQKEERT